MFPAKHEDLPTQDMIDGTTDFILLSAGVPLGREPHPFARKFQETQPDFATLAGYHMRAAGIDFDIERRDANVAPALSQAGFGDTIATAATLAARYRADLAGRDVQRMTAQRQVPDGKPTGQPVLEMKELTLNREGEQITQIMIIGAGEETTQVQMSGSLVGITRHLSLGMPVGLMGEAFGLFGDMAGRNEMQRLVSLLTDNAAMADGVALFDASVSNILTSASIDMAHIGASVAALRSVPNGAGDPCNAEARVMLVPPENEAAFLVLAATLEAGNQPRLDIVSSAELAGTNFTYTIGDPEAVPALVRTTLLGGDGSGVSVERMDSRRMHRFDGDIYRARHDVGIDAISHAVVRNTLS